MMRIRDLSIEFGVPLHLDGARLFNAAVALGVPASELAAMADTVSLSLNKGLGAPLGAHSRWARRRHCRSGAGTPIVRRWMATSDHTGGGRRRRPGDHGRTDSPMTTATPNAWPRAWPASKVSQVEAGSPVTNIVFATPDRPNLDAAALAEGLLAEQVLVGVYEPGMIRMVTHCDIDEAAIGHVLEVFSNLLQRPVHK